MIDGPGNAHAFWRVVIVPQNASPLKVRVSRWSAERERASKDRRSLLTLAVPKGLRKKTPF